MDGWTGGRRDDWTEDGRRRSDIGKNNEEHAGILAPVKSATLTFGISRGKNAGIRIRDAGMLGCWKKVGSKE